jgi:Cu/Ag efflux protein CusF
MDDRRLPSSRLRTAGFLGLFFLLGAARVAPAAAETRPPQLHGVVESVDVPAGTVTVAHDAFPGMPMAMTMTFGAGPRDVLRRLHPRDRIEALVDERPKIWLLYRIRVVEMARRERSR